MLVFSILWRLRGFDNMHLQIWGVILVLTIISFSETHAYGYCKFNEKPNFGLPKTVGEITAANATLPVTGLTFSGNYTDILYYVNAEGQNKVYAINACTGQVVGAVTVANETNVNWQALALGLCLPPMTGSCLYIHDSDQRRIIILKEDENPAQFTTREPDRVIDYTFKAGDSSNKESQSIFVTCDCNIHFFNVEDEGKQVRLYTIFTHTGDYTAMATLQMNFPTATRGPVAASLSKDCCELLVKTEDKIYYLPVHKSKLIKQHLQLLPLVSNPDCKAVSWSLTQDGFYTALDKVPTPLALYPRNKNLPESKFALGKTIGGVDSNKYSDISGVATSRVHRNTLYMINGFLVDDVLITQKFEGETIGEIQTIIGPGGNAVNNFAWSDIATGPCDLRPNCFCLYINDGGSFQGGSGPQNVIYIIPEVANPYLVTQINEEDIKQISYSRFGNKFTSNAIMVGCDKKIYVFDLALNFGDPINVYELVEVTPGQFSTHCVATFPNPSTQPGPVAADISPCCDEILVKFRDNVLHYKLKNDKVGQAFLNEPCVLPYVPECKGNSISFTFDCQSYVTVDDHDFDDPSPLKIYNRLPCCKNVTLTKY